MSTSSQESSLAVKVLIDKFFSQHSPGKSLDYYFKLLVSLAIHLASSDAIEKVKLVDFTWKLGDLIGSANFLCSDIELQEDVQV